MTLHLIQKSPFEHSALKDCLAIIDNNDAILLMQDGVLACQHNLLDTTNTNYPIYAINDDLRARGLDPSNNIQAIEFTGFVKLCETATRVISWY